MSHLMIIQIGPVQEFIASARRSRDLWYGSWMLSELSKAAAKAIVDSGGQLIFPASADMHDLDPQYSIRADTLLLPAYLFSINHSLKSRRYF